MAEEASEHPGVALLRRAEAATQRMRAANTNRVLIRDMAMLIVQQAGIIDDLSQKLADTPRIIVPGRIHG